jgi:hypothetical protein
LRYDIGSQLGSREALADHQPRADGWIQVASRDVSDGEGHGEDGQAERKGDTEEADSDRWKACGQYGGAASTKYQPEGSEEFSERTFPDTQGFTSRVKLGCF